METNETGALSQKEKAKQLVLTFMQNIIFSIKQNIEADTIEAAKQCALIAVDEIISAIDWHEFETPNKEIEYWQEVKTEIQKL